MRLRSKLCVINVVVWAAIIIVGLGWLFNGESLNSPGTATNPEVIIPFMLFVGACLFGMIRVNEMITGRLRRH
jgi:hypothetical protein